MNKILNPLHKLFLVSAYSFSFWKICWVCLGRGDQGIERPCIYKHFFLNILKLYIIHILYDLRRYANRNRKRSLTISHVNNLPMYSKPSIWMGWERLATTNYTKENGDAWGLNLNIYNYIGPTIIACYLDLYFPF